LKEATEVRHNQFSKNLSRSFTSAADVTTIICTTFGENLFSYSRFKKRSGSIGNAVGSLKKFAITFTLNPTVDNNQLFMPVNLMTGLIRVSNVFVNLFHQSTVFNV
jgi:hypothetical protein